MANHHTFWTTAREMFQRGGIRPFFVGTSATVLRDVIFGGSFAIFRREIPLTLNKINNENNTLSDKDKSQIIPTIKVNQFTINLLAGCLATAASSPINYVRNIHYATPADQPAESHMKILQRLWQLAAAESTFFKRCKYLQSRLRIGWGTARVGCGMALAAQLYDLCSSKFKN